MRPAARAAGDAEAVQPEVVGQREDVGGGVGHVAPGLPAGPAVPGAVGGEEADAGAHVDALVRPPRVAAAGRAVQSDHRVAVRVAPLLPGQGPAVGQDQGAGHPSPATSTVRAAAAARARSRACSTVSPWARAPPGAGPGATSACRRPAPARSAPASAVRQTGVGRHALARSRAPRRRRRRARHDEVVGADGQPEDGAHVQGELAGRLATSVTMPVSCGRGETSLNSTSSSAVTNSSTPNRPCPPSASHDAPSRSRVARASATLAHRVRLPRLAVVAGLLHVPDRRADGDAAGVADGEQGDLVGEVDEPLDDHRPVLHARALAGVGQAASGSSPGCTVDWPLPLQLITGLTTQGVPIASTAARYSSSVEAKR